MMRWESVRGHGCQCCSREGAPVGGRGGWGDEGGGSAGVTVMAGAGGGAAGLERDIWKLAARRETAEGGKPAPRCSGRVYRATGAATGAAGIGAPGGGGGGCRSGAGGATREEVTPEGRPVLAAGRRVE